MNYKETINKIADWLLTILKGLILVSWIYLLSWGASRAINGDFANLTLPSYGSLFSGGSDFYSYPSRPGESGQTAREILQGMEAYGDDALKVTAVLDYVCPDWSKTGDEKMVQINREEDEKKAAAAKLAKDADKKDPDRDQYFTRRPDNPAHDRLYSECRELYYRVTDRFEAYASDPQFNPDSNKLVCNFLTPFFRPNDFIIPSEGLEFTPELKSWISRWRDSSKVHTARVALLNTFVLLIIIGAFGSLIFLTKDYIFSSRTTPFASYIFRPVLGIFLAISMFVVDIAVNALVSTSDILQVRRETLFLLALAAGLLSEKAYSVIEKRARVALDEAEEKSAKAQQDKPTDPAVPVAAPEAKPAQT